MVTYYYSISESYFCGLIGSLVYDALAFDFTTLLERLTIFSYWISGSSFLISSTSGFVYIRG
jgi:hypothetical protein